MSVTLLITIFTCIISYMAFNNHTMMAKLMHYPYVESRQGEYYRMLSSGLIHSNWLHLIINMVVFYQFGTIVESAFLSIFGETAGRINYILLYFLTIVVADIPTYLKHRNNPNFMSVGASGAVSGITFVYALFAPWAMLLIYGILPIPAIVSAVLYLVYSSYASRRGGDNVDHDAHFYGAVFGVLFTIALKPSLINYFLSELINDAPWAK